MDLSAYNLEDVILTAIKSEVEAKEVYENLSKKITGNLLLSDRIRFLATEEEKHREYFEELYKDIFPEREIVLLEKSPVPLPEIRLEGGKVRVSQVIEAAMKAELAARDFYLSMVDLFEDNPGVQKMLTYIAQMELGHYKLLETEKEIVEKFEDIEIEWPMTHMGP